MSNQRPFQIADRARLQVSQVFCNCRKSTLDKMNDEGPLQIGQAAESAPGDLEQRGSLVDRQPSFVDVLMHAQVAFEECSAGTLGARVKAGAHLYVLSNNHVLALEDDAPIGSDILQPGRYDTNCSTSTDDVIAANSVICSTDPVGADSRAVEFMGLRADQVGHIVLAEKSGLGQIDYRAAGYVIGSGMMESTCKQLVAQRLKGPGMQWSEAGALAMTALIAHRINGTWDRFWASRPLQRAA